MIISISGRKQHGKDTVATFIQELTHDTPSLVGLEGLSNMTWQRKQWAKKLKETAASLLGISVDRFEDENFKNSLMPQMWNKLVPKSISKAEILKQAAEAGMTIKSFRELHGWKRNAATPGLYWASEIKPMTYRQFLQQLGTNVCRSIHENFWVNLTMQDYEGFPEKFMSEPDFLHGYRHTSCIKCGDSFLGFKHQARCQSCIEKDPLRYPSWLFTDTRFPNEVGASETFGAATIRVINPRVEKPEQEHESEYALDRHEFKYIIINDGTREELKEKTRSMLLQIKGDGVWEKHS